MSLSPEAAAVAGEFAVAADNAVAGDDDADAVVSVRLRHGAHGFRIADCLRLLGIRAGLAVGDGDERVPDLFLERRARDDERYVEFFSPTVEIFLELFFKRVEMPVLSAQKFGVHIFFQPIQLRLYHPPVNEFEEADAIIGRAGEHRPQWCGDSGDIYELPAGALAWRDAGRLLERIREAGEGFVAGFERRVNNFAALPDPAECTAYAQGPEVALEGHPVMFLEPSAHPCRFQSVCPEGSVVQPDIRILMNLVQQWFQPIGRLAAVQERFANPAGPVAVEQRVANGGKEFHVLFLRFPCRAGEPAENAGCLHTYVIHTVEIAVLFQQSLI